MRLKCGIVLLCLGFVTIACSKKMSDANAKTKRNAVWVANSTELADALKLAKPGDSIIMKDGIYKGKFVIPETANGSANNPITLIGNKQAIIDGGTTETGYALHLKASYWHLTGFTVTNALKGIIADNANHTIMDAIEVTKVGEEGIHLRKASSNNVIKNCKITYTGLKTPDYGEGIYIGSAYSNWPKYTNNQPDKCDENQILNNTIGPFVAAECIDIKEGTSKGIIRGNTFYSKGITGANSADSWIDVKGNSYLIENNTGINEQPSVLKDGYQINCAYAGWGCYNEFKNNVCNVNAGGFGFNVRLKSSKGEAVGNKIYKNNKVNNAASGTANIPLLTN